jgi:hypothetical protein
MTYGQSEQARAPYTHEPKDVPRCEALSLLQKPLHNRGNSAKFVPSPCVEGLGPSVARARVLVHEVARAEELRVAASITPPEASW